MLEQNNFITEEYNKRINEETIFSFLGYFDYKIMLEVLKTVKTNLNETSSNVLLKKRCYHAAGECIENIIRHSDNTVFNQAFFILNLSDLEFEIITGNFVNDPDAETIKSIYNDFKSKDMITIKKDYSNKLHSTNISEKGGAGLGLFDIIIKSNNRWVVDFSTTKSFYKLCLISIKIS